MNEDSLSTKVKAEIAFDAIMQLVPYIGSPISSVLSGIRQERINQRVENFHLKVVSDIEELRARKIESNVDPLLLEEIILKIYEKAESSVSDAKLENFRKFLKTNILHPPNEDFDERVIFLNDLADMSDLECRVLAFLATRSNGVMVGSLESAGVTQYAFLGAVERLRSRGFIVSVRGEFTMNGQCDEALGAIVSVSNYGSKFVEYCLN